MSTSFEDLMVVTVSSLSLGITPCNLVIFTDDSEKCAAFIFRRDLKMKAVISFVTSVNIYQDTFFYHEDLGSAFLRTVSKYLSDHTGSHFGRK
jgi:hypothetical protein